MKTYHLCSWCTITGNFCITHIMHSVDFNSPVLYKKVRLHCTEASNKISCMFFYVTILWNPLEERQKFDISTVVGM